MEELTVSEIAERVAPAGDEAAVERLTRQLRHWTLSHVLEPIGGLHTGSGRHRRYSAQSVYIAALIAELANMGFPIRLLWAVATAVNAIYWAKANPRWLQAIEGEADILLYFSPRFRAGEKLDMPGLEIPMVMNLIDAKEGADFASKNDSCVIVNLTRLFAPLRS